MTKGSDQSTGKDLHLLSVAVTSAFCDLASVIQIQAQINRVVGCSSYFKQYFAYMLLPSQRERKIFFKQFHVSLAFRFLL